MLALVGAVALAIATLALDMRRADAADAPSALVLLLVGVAAAQSLLIVRGQLFSLALFPVLVLILRNQARLPSEAVWLLPPLFALWSNLHGGVLVGVAVAGSYLLLHRVRRTPVTAIAVLVASLGAVLLTPSLLDTRRYYHGVIGSEAAVGHEGLWAPLSLDMPLDLAFLVAGIPLVIAALASRPRFWELVALTGLAAMTIQAGRNAVWLVLFAATPAAAWLTGSREWRFHPPRFVTAVLAACLAGVLAIGLGRAPVPPGAGEKLRARAALESGSAPILADDINAEALALDGRIVWIANPLDAFDLGDQRLYLDWIAGRTSGDALPKAFPAALVTVDSPPAVRLARDDGWRVAAKRRARGAVRARPALSSPGIVRRRGGCCDHGCSVVLKPDAKTPLSALRLAELAAEVGFPAGVINIVPGDGPGTGSYLVGHPGVDKVAFTGSTATGSEIMRLAAPTLKRITLELGGKSPNIVFADADLADAVPSSVWAIYYAAGQSCEARSRVLVEKPIYDSVVAAFAEKAAAVKVGDPLDEETQMGSLISPEHRDRVHGFVEQGREQGAEVVLGGSPVDGAGAFYPPTVLSACDSSMSVAQEEIFGPVVTVIPFEDEADAVRIANDVRYGLMATVWTGDPARGHRLARQIKSGTVGINMPYTAFPGIPFGGYKQSGFGRELGLEALDLYLETKSVVVGTGARPANPFGL